MTELDRVREVGRYRDNLRDEVDGAAMYTALAQLERDEHLAEVYRRLAATEQRHASLWLQKLHDTGTTEGLPGPSRRARILIGLARRFGSRLLMSTLAEQERAGQFMYDDQPEAEGTSLRADERSHARVLQAVLDSGASGMSGPSLARLEGRHSAVGGNSLRAAVLGANDGLVSNLALVMGVAGASISNSAVLVAGFAGLLAGAISMALGEWLSVQSSRELYERQIATERSEIEQIPEEETDELALIYQAKGMPGEEAQALATKIMQDTDTALDTLTREELGIDPDDLGGSPWSAAGASFFLFTLGAIVPVFPFLFLSGSAAIVASLAASGVALFLVGAAITLVTASSVWRSGLRQMTFGLGAAVITFAIGTLLGVAIG